MEVTLRKMGNSTAVIVPPTVLRDLGMSAGQKLSLTTTPDGRIILAPKCKFALADLIAQCDPKPPADLAPWNSMRPVGQEFL
jgi:antitoxin ChpS